MVDNLVDSSKANIAAAAVVRAVDSAQWQVTSWEEASMTRAAISMATLTLDLRTKRTPEAHRQIHTSHRRKPLHLVTLRLRVVRTSRRDSTMSAPVQGSTARIKRNLAVQRRIRASIASKLSMATIKRSRSTDNSKRQATARKHPASMAAMERSQVHRISMAHIRLRVNSSMVSKGAIAHLRPTINSASNSRVDMVSNRSHRHHCTVRRRNQGTDHSSPSLRLRHSIPILKVITDNNNSNLGMHNNPTANRKLLSNSTKPMLQINSRVEATVANLREGMADSSSMVSSSRRTQRGDDELVECLYRA